MTDREHDHVDWEAAYAGDAPDTPVDSELVALAQTSTPGTEVRVSSHIHGPDRRELPIAIVVAGHPGPLTEEL